MCSCGRQIIRRNSQNAQLWWSQHESGTDKNSECAKNLNENDSHEFKWSILSLAPKFLVKRKILKLISLRHWIQFWIIS